MINRIIIFLLLYIFLNGCDVNRFINKPSSSDPAQDFLLFLLLSREDSNYDLYRYNPNPNLGLGEVRPNAVRFSLPNREEDRSGRINLIFIHGWNFKERNSDPPADFAYKIAQIEDTWLNAIQFIDKLDTNIQDRFNFYFYTYRTSNRIFDNGRRFLNETTRFFKDEDQIVVVAHSMGGLVTREAMLQSQERDLYNGLISLGTPYFGSPFAVSDFVGFNPILQELVSFYTSTDGGRDLAHSNQLDNQVEISGGINLYLDRLSAINESLDSRTVAYYGNMTDCNLGELVLYQTSCNILKNQNVAFEINDAIVLGNSARLGGRAKETIQKENFDHSMLAFRIIDTEAGETFFLEVMNKILNTTW
ncbi:MAG: hypothetical protein JJT78_02995 [Leptospira sp.]|nr:hypothetical protein [Leptospira sp.]